MLAGEDQLSKRRKRQQARQSGQVDVNEIQQCTSTSSDHAPSSYYPHSSSSPHSVGDSRSPPFKPHYQAASNSCYQSRAGYSQDDGCDSSMHANRLSSNSHFDLCPSSMHEHHAGYPPAHIYERKWSQCSQDSMDKSPSSTTPQHSPPYPTSSTSMPSYTSRSPYPSTEEASSSTALGEPMHKCLKIERPSHDDTSFYMEPVPSSQIKSLNESITASPEHFDQTPDVKSEPLTGNEEYSVPLSPYIKDMLNQLHTVYNEIFEAAYAPEHVPKFTDNPKTADELFNMTDIFIRRLIRFAKNLPEFKNLDQSDQIQLLKVILLILLPTPTSPQNLNKISTKNILIFYTYHNLFVLISF